MLRILLLALALQTPSDSLVEVRVREVASKLRCVVCQGLSIYDSPATLAVDMKNVVREQVRAGKSNEEIKEYFVAKYGEKILLEPEARGFNLTVYIMPAIMLLGGLFLVFFLTRKWSHGRRMVPADEDSSAA